MKNPFLLFLWVALAHVFILVLKERVVKLSRRVDELERKK